MTIGDTVAPNAINLIWENMTAAQGEWLRTSGLRYGLVATEIPDGTGFNNRQDGDWATRWQGFQSAARGCAIHLVDGAVGPASLL